MNTLIHNLDLFDASLIVSALSCGLVTGFILTYAIVVMPGLAKLTDKNFLRAFQVTDEIIQNNQPLFMLIWVGSTISVITAIFTSIVFKISVCRHSQGVLCRARSLHWYNTRYDKCVC